MTTQTTTGPPGAVHTELGPYGESAQPSWRALDWREHERSIEIERRRVGYVELGAGDEAVLFVHGYSGTWRWWLETLPAVAQGRRAIAVDLPGCGASDMPVERLTLERWCRQLDLLCERLELGRVTVVGFSLGTIVAPQLAARYPERVAKVVCVGGPLLSLTRLRSEPVATVRRHPQMAAVAASEVLTMKIPLPEHLLREVARRPRLRKLALGSYARRPERLAPDVVRMLLVGLGAPSAIPALRDVFSYDVYEGLNRIECPFLAVNGSDDKLVPAADVEELVRRLPHAQARLFEDTGHWSQIERASAFNAELIRFLDERPA